MTDAVFTNNAQLQQVFLFAGMGFLLGLYYDAVKLLRLCRPMKKTGVFVTDVLYCLSGSLLWFLFALTVNGGQLRVYAAAATLTGCAAERLTLGRLLEMILPPTVRVIRQCLRVLTMVMTAPFRGLFRLLTPLFRRVKQFFGKFLRKSAKKGNFFLKKGLKKSCERVYNDKE